MHPRASSTESLAFPAISFNIPKKRMRTRMGVQFNLSGEALGPDAVFGPENQNPHPLAKGARRVGHPLLSLVLQASGLRQHVIVNRLRFFHRRRGENLRRRTLRHLRQRNSSASSIVFT